MSNRNLATAINMQISLVIILYIPQYQLGLKSRTFFNRSAEARFYSSWGRIPVDEGMLHNGYSPGVRCYIRGRVFDSQHPILHRHGTMTVLRQSSRRAYPFRSPLPHRIVLLPATAEILFLSGYNLRQPPPANRSTNDWTRSVAVRAITCTNTTDNGADHELRVISITSTPRLTGGQHPRGQQYLLKSLSVEKQWSKRSGWKTIAMTLTTGENQRTPRVTERTERIDALTACKYLWIATAAAVLRNVEESGQKSAGT
ncbi:hypothetical protein J6590_027644 [Homalodisca vitripennis]|nr:hypothetical protein J6590_027644 [Homalodisca vitripennis]